MLSIALFCIACFAPQVYRTFNSNPVMIHPFYFMPETAISVAWYLKDIGEMISYSVIMFIVTLVLKPIESHLEDVKWSGHLGLLSFVKLWHRFFFVIFVISVFDLGHYVLAFKQSEVFFLVLNGFFVVLTGRYAYKIYRK